MTNSTENMIEDVVGGDIQDIPENGITGEDAIDTPAVTPTVELSLPEQLAASNIATASMETDLFVSHKTVKRCPMNRADYNAYRGWELPADENGADEGYLVEYTDGGAPNHPWHTGYISWSPKPQFDTGYTESMQHEIEKENFVNACIDIHDKRKTLHNSTVDGAHKNVPDLKVYGNGDLFQLVCKASSESEKWMKSTKAMEIDKVGCVVQVTTQQQNEDGSYSIAEALTFVPGVRVVPIKNDKANGRMLAKF